jgi:LysM repeat protein/RNA polymerase subunit RPABC4/transcription elongation factor Spt4
MGDVDGTARLGAKGARHGPNGEYLTVCGHCGAGLSADQHICAQCGTLRKSRQIRCRHCGTAHSPGSAACRVCQQPLRRDWFRPALVALVVVATVALVFVAATWLGGRLPLPRFPVAANASPPVVPKVAMLEVTAVNSAAPAPSSTLTPTHTPEPTLVPTQVASPSRMPSIAPTSTDTPAPTEPTTATPSPTFTPSTVPTRTPRPTRVPTRTLRPTSTATGAPTLAATSTSTATPTDAPTETLVPTASAAPTPIIHSVKLGDTLYDIALEYGTTVDAIKAQNGLESNQLRVGQQLIIPRGTITPAPSPTTIPTATPAQ